MRWTAAKRVGFSFRAVSRLRDRGSGMVEFGGAVALVAVITTVVVAAVPGQVTDLLDGAVCSVSSCADESTDAGADSDNEKPQPKRTEDHTIPCSQAPCNEEKPQPKYTYEDTIRCVRAPCPTSTPHPPGP